MSSGGGGLLKIKLSSGYRKLGLVRTTVTSYKLPGNIFCRLSFSPSRGLLGSVLVVTLCQCRQLHNLAALSTALGDISCVFKCNNIAIEKHKFFRFCTYFELCSCI